MPLTNSQKQLAYIQRMQAKGFKKVQLWVPEADEVRVRKYVKRVCSQYKEAMGIK